MPVVPSNEAIVESADQAASVVVPELKDLSGLVKDDGGFGEQTLLQGPTPTPIDVQSILGREPIAIAETI